MPARIVIKGRAWWGSPELREHDRIRRKRAQAVPHGRKDTDREGQLVGAGAIAPTSAESPFREGASFRCEEDKVTYRVVRHLDPTQGWATSGFWQDRWRCKHHEVLALVERGLLDAAMEHGSQVRRYRCRDERLVLKSPVMATVERRRAKYREQFRKKGPKK